MTTTSKKTVRRPMSRAAPSAPNSEPQPQPKPAKLEEQLNFSNVTEFRRSILEAIPRLQENHFLRFVITKHGSPVAVVMSYEAYEVLRRITNRVLDEDEAKSKETILSEAYQRMTGEAPPADAVPATPNSALEGDIPDSELFRIHVRQIVKQAVRDTIDALEKSSRLKGQSDNT